LDEREILSVYLSFRCLRVSYRRGFARTCGGGGACQGQET
jgi:hypothetical protein